MGGSTLFVNYGFALLHLDDRWIKAALAFDRELCKCFGARPTEFDGREHAILQKFDAQGRRHMEYVNKRSCWSDFPYETFTATMRAAYPTAAWELCIGDAHFAP